MKNFIQSIFEESIRVKQETLKTQSDKIVQAADQIVNSLESGGKILVMGNGGSAADSQHFVAELIGRFQKERRSFPAIALTTDTSILTAIGNDYGFDKVFSRQIEGLGVPKDCLLGFSTSGNSANILEGFKKAKALGLKTIGLTGGDGGKMKELCDVVIVVPSKVTARVQESHICIIHCLCEWIENRLSLSKS